MGRKAANDNLNRPTSYDAELLAHRHFLKMLARKFVGPAEREELIQDTCLYALRRWSLYKADYAFTTWLSLMMKNVLSDRKAAAAAEKRTGRQVAIDMTLLAAPEEHDDEIALTQVLAAIPEGREGLVIRRRLLGDKQKDIAADLGVTKNRVQQIEIEGARTIRRTLMMRTLTRRYGRAA